MEEKANVFLNGNNAEDGVVILNLSLDELNNSNVSLEASSFENLDEDLTRLQQLLESWNLLQLLPVLKGK